MNSTKEQIQHSPATDGKPPVVGSASDGFTSFDVFRHTGDEVEFRVKCSSCGMSAISSLAMRPPVIAQSAYFIRRHCLSFTCHVLVGIFTA